ncbi:MAG: hypothetical protein QOF78_1794 [Phycisphaerales bacterium]|jgi:hypothetical protein|nr:hypothetical protein [Phycisphaerales bacterium]
MKKSFCLSVCICVHLWFIPGCSSDKHPTTRPATVRERQDAALADPFGYSPNMNSAETDISGGKLNELNRGAMRKDIDHVLNP